MDKNITRFQLGLVVTDARERRNARIASRIAATLSTLNALGRQLLLYAGMNAAMVFLLAVAASLAMSLIMTGKLELFSRWFWIAAFACYFFNLMTMARWRRRTLLEMSLGARNKLLGKDLGRYGDHPSRIAGRTVEAAKQEADIPTAAMMLWNIPFVTVGYLISISLLLVFTLSVFFWTGDHALGGLIIESGHRDFLSILLKNVEYVGDIVLLNAFSAFEVGLSDTYFSSSFWVRLYIFAIYSLHFVNLFEYVKEYINSPQKAEVVSLRQSLALRFGGEQQSI